LKRDAEKKRHCALGGTRRDVSTTMPDFLKRHRKTEVTTLLGQKQINESGEKNSTRNYEPSNALLDCTARKSRSRGRTKFSKGVRERKFGENREKLAVVT